MRNLTPNIVEAIQDEVKTFFSIYVSYYNRFKLLNVFLCRLKGFVFCVAKHGDQRLWYRTLDQSRPNGEQDSK